MISLHHDMRPIALVLTRERSYELDSLGVTKIVPFLEGDGSTWFGIYCDEHLNSRVPLLHVTEIAYNLE